VHFLRNTGAVRTLNN